MANTPPTLEIGHILEDAGQGWRDRMFVVANDIGADYWGQEID